MRSLVVFGFGVPAGFEAASTFGHVTGIDTLHNRNRNLALLGTKIDVWRIHQLWDQNSKIRPAPFTLLPAACFGTFHEAALAIAKGPLQEVVVSLTPILSIWVMLGRIQHKRLSSRP